MTGRIKYAKKERLKYLHFLTRPQISTINSTKQLKSWIMINNFKYDKKNKI